MDRLPDEIILQIATHLAPQEVITFSVASKRFCFLTRDSNHWRQRCYDDSRAAARERRQALIARQSQSMAALVRAMHELPRSLASTTTNDSEPSRPSDSLRLRKSTRRLANWDPSYAGEKVNYYQEYIHRHAPIRMSWFEQMSDNEVEGCDAIEATGAGVLFDANGRASKLYAPLDDGSIGVWEASFPRLETEKRRLPGQRLDLSPKGILLQEGSTTSIHRANGVVECVSIDSQQQRGYFAIANDLVEVDLATLQPITRSTFSWPINALSDVEPGVPITVGTAMYLQLFDPRLRQSQSVSPSSDLASPANNATELINSPRPQQSLLSQPGPLSILHLDRYTSSDSIWVAGRFTHLLNYDRRYFPRLQGTIHSGSRVSSMTALPCCRTAQHREAGHCGSPSQITNAHNGPTLIVAGAYKGKGSLELYGLRSYVSDEASSHSNASLNRTSSSTGGVGLRSIRMQNRQTASSSKLLSVASHGMKVVYSDGDAKVKWVERDGTTPVREFSIAPASTNPASSSANSDADTMLDNGLWAQNWESNNGDIVQKLIPTIHRSILASNSYTPQLHEDNLIVWTGDGRLGMLGFGKHNGWAEDSWRDRLETATEDQTRLREEREHSTRMKRALQWQADEARFMTGLGLPFQQSL